MGFFDGYNVSTAGFIPQESPPEHIIAIAIT
jgi:hypothetical protein